VCTESPSFIKKSEEAAIEGLDVHGRVERGGSEGVDEGVP